LFACHETIDIIININQNSLSRKNGQERLLFILLFWLAQGSVQLGLLLPSRRRHTRNDRKGSHNFMLGFGCCLFLSSVMFSKSVAAVRPIACTWTQKLLMSTQAPKFVSLVHRHQEFLDSVKNVGEGSVELNRRGQILEIYLNDPAKKNAMSGRMMYQLAEVVQRIHETITHDDTVVGLVLRGSGDCFCSGADLQFVASVVNTPERGVLMARFMIEALDSLRHSGLISLCALNGSAVGGGSELSTVGDFRIMEDNDRRFIQFAHPTLGASPAWGGAARLGSIVGRRQAIKIATTGKKIYPKEALQLGLVDQLVKIEKEEDWIAVIDEFFKPYTDMKYPASVRAIKQTIAAPEFMTPQDALELEIDELRVRWYSKEHAAVMNKYAPK
jgi:enoyl-CoA hydratase/carnithine racemase